MMVRWKRLRAMDGRGASIHREGIGLGERQRGHQAENENEKEHDEMN